MAVLYICRHGQTENNKRGRLSGWIDSPLTEEGLQNIQSTAAKLKSNDVRFDAIYSSDLGRAFMTAHTIARELSFTGEVRQLFGLRENGYGDIAYMPLIEAETIYPELHRVTNYTPQNGESLGHMQQRVLNTVAKLDNEHAGQTLLLSAHDGVIKAIYTSFSGEDLGWHNSNYGYGHDYVAKFTIEGGRVRTFEEVV